MKVPGALAEASGISHEKRWSSVARCEGRNKGLIAGFEFSFEAKRISGPRRIQF
jgi:hypothetical protein